MIQLYEFLGNLAARNVVKEFLEMIKNMEEVGEPLNRENVSHTLGK